MDVLENKMKYNFSNGRALLSLTFKNEEVILYQLEMMTNNNIPKLLKSHFDRVDGDIRLFFDVTSLITLEKLFERRIIGRQDFLYIIKQVISLLEGIEEYLLDYNGIVFDKKCIYVDPATLDVYFMYLPVPGSTDRLETLKRLLLESIVNDINFKNEKVDNYIQKLLEILKNRELSLELLKDYLKEVENKSEISIQDSQISFKKPETEEMPEIEKFQTGFEEKIIFSYPLKSYIILFSTAGLFILFGIILCLTGTLSVNSPDFLLTLFGYLLIGGALTYLIYTKFFTSDKKTERKIQKPVADTVENKKLRDFKSDLSEQIKNFREQKIQSNKDSFNQINNNPVKNEYYYYVNKNIRMNEHEAAASTEYRDFCDSDSTVLLGAGNITIPYLKRAKNSEIVVLKSFPFMIGRLSEQVDYCLQNPAVGKLHAEITKEGDEYFITDMNSRNGTMINGRQIMPGVGQSIDSGDIITFANEEFSFYC